jgi:hypothetical protein
MLKRYHMVQNHQERIDFHLNIPLKLNKLVFLAFGLHLMDSIGFLSHDQYN